MSSALVVLVLLLSRCSFFFDIVLSIQIAPDKDSENPDSSRKATKESIRESECSDFAPDDPKYHHIGVMLTNSLMKAIEKRVNEEDENKANNTKDTAVAVKDKENDKGTIFASLSTK